MENTVGSVKLEESVTPGTFAFEAWKAFFARTPKNASIIADVEAIEKTWNLLGLGA